MREIGCVVALLMGITGSTHGQLDDPVVIRIPASVRSAGLNGAGAALIGNAASIFVNPTGLATIRHIAVEVSYQAASLGARATMGAAAWRVRQFDVGFAVQRYNSGSFSNTAPATVENELLVTGALVYRFGLLALGASTKYLNRDRGGTPDRAVGADVGLAVAVFDIMALGFSIQNVGGNLRRGSNLELRSRVRLGFTMNYVDPQEGFRLLSTVEVQWPQRLSALWIFGGEGGVVVNGVGIVGRLGYRTRPDPTYHPALSYGATFELGAFDVDLARESRGITGSPASYLGVRVAF